MTQKPYFGLILEFWIIFLIFYEWIILLNILDSIEWIFFWMNILDFVWMNICLNEYFGFFFYFWMIFLKFLWMNNSIEFSLLNWKNIFLNEYFGFCFELNHFWAKFNEKMNFQNVSNRATSLTQNLLYVGIYSFCHKYKDHWMQVKKMYSIYFELKVSS